MASSAVHEAPAVSATARAAVGTVGRASGTLPGRAADDPVRFDMPRTDEPRPSTGIPS